MRSPWSLLLAEQAQLSQSLHFLGEVLRPSDHLRALLWTRSNSSTSFFVLCPDLDAVLQMGPHRAEQRGTIPSIPSLSLLPPSVDAAQGTVGLPGCECTLLPHV